jgi:PHD/YefM family antitoxin component YafN of YafNO toxin-antitoxin module
MKELNLSDTISNSELKEKVRRFVYNNQNSLPVSISSSNHKAVIMVLEEGDFRFVIKDNLILVTE